MAESDHTSRFAISVRDLVVGFGDQIVLDHLSLDVAAAKSSASSALRAAASRFCCAPSSAFCAETGRARSACSASIAIRRRRKRCERIERRWGVLFQQGALFSSLTARQNVEFPIREYLQAVATACARRWRSPSSEWSGFSAEDAEKYPAELSGGMTKRARSARALALDPEIVFLDEPTSGPGSDRGRRVRRADQDPAADARPHSLHGHPRSRQPAYAVCDRIAVLADGKIVVEGPIATVLACEHPWVKAYFRGKRTREPSQIRGQPAN